MSYLIGVCLLRVGVGTHMWPRAGVWVMLYQRTTMWAVKQSDLHRNAEHEGFRELPWLVTSWAFPLTD